MVDPAQGQRSAHFTFGGSGMLQAHFAGSALMVQCASFGIKVACSAVGSIRAIHQLLAVYDVRRGKVYALRPEYNPLGLDTPNRFF